MKIILLRCPGVIGCEMMFLFDMREIIQNFSFQGAEVVIKVALAILVVHKEQLLSCQGFEELSDYLKYKVSYRHLIQYSKVLFVLPSHFLLVRRQQLGWVHKQQRINVSGQNAKAGLINKQRQTFPLNRRRC